MALEKFYLAVPYSERAAKYVHAAVDLTQRISQSRIAPVFRPGLGLHWFRRHE